MSSLDTTPRSRQAAAVLGAGIAVTGLAVLVWPGVTVLVLGFWLGMALVLYGIKELLDGAFGVGGSRTWAVVVGVASVIAGLTLLFAPLFTAAAIGTLVGLSWLIDGALAIVGAFVVAERRLVRGAFGALSVVAGIAVLGQPALSLVALTWFAGIWMLVVGLVVVGWAVFVGRSTQTSAI